MLDALIVIAIAGFVLLATLVQLRVWAGTRAPDGVDWERRWSVLEFTERISEQPVVDPKRSSRFPVLTHWTMLDENRCVYSVNAQYMSGAIGMATREGDEVRVEVKVKPWRVLILVAFGIFGAAVMLQPLLNYPDAAKWVMLAACGLILAPLLVALCWLIMTLWWTRFFRFGCQEIIRFQWSASAPDGGAKRSEIPG